MTSSTIRAQVLLSLGAIVVLFIAGLGAQEIGRAHV